MKRRFLFLLTAACLAGALAVPAFAEEVVAEETSVTFNGKELVEDYSAESVSLGNNMQPGDTLRQVINLKNDGEKATSWYVSNEVLSTLEENQTASGGAYTYKLTYESGGESRDIYNSETVGGEGTQTEGLKEATQGLEDYVFLGEISAKSTGAVVLEIGLDGMSQINSYQNSDARVRVNFAVEEAQDAARTTVVKSVKTGDWMQTLPFILLTAVSGLALAGFGAVSLRRGKKR